MTGAVVNNSALVFYYNSNETFAGPISGSGAVSTLGGNVLTLTNSANSYSGLTTVSAGTLQLGSGAAGYDATLTGNVLLGNNAVLALDNAGAVTYPGSIGGNGALVKLGPGWRP